MQVPLNAIPTHSPPDHDNDVIVWDDTGEWDRGWFGHGKWHTMGGAKERHLDESANLIWWAEIAVLLPGGAYYFESERNKETT